MKLLSIALVNHDTNFSFYDNGDFKYHKLERTKQEKRYVLYPITRWKNEVENLWNIKIDEIDDIIFQFDSYTMLPKHLQKRISKSDFLQKLDNDVCEYLDVKNAWFIGHHYSHAKSTWMLEDKETDVQIVIDGLGDNRPWTVYRGETVVGMGDIRNGSIGWGMRDAGKFLGINAIHQNDIAGKLMGLQSYGIIDNDFLNILSEFTIEDANKIFDRSLWKERSSYNNWIRTVHHKIGDLLVDFFKKYANTNDIISYSGGVAQNVVWNTKLKKTFPNIIIPPHSSDEGISLGAIKVLFDLYNISFSKIKHFPYCQSDISPPNKPTDETINRIVDLLVDNKTVGVYFDNGEIGPRALGNRSILMNPKIKNGKNKINDIKNREYYRPFGAVILEEYFDKYFNGVSDEYMLYTSTFKEDSEIYESISHIDNTCRVQICKIGYIKNILQEFNKRTGCPMLLNTSLNLSGKPIAGYPQDAFSLFQSSKLDCVVIGDKIYENKF
jgi:carbamoyltransferase|tara:strand:- start:3788 stop:5275 length:1488 start_codon:yes stop_codon:yes gene_type:complete